MSEEKIEVIAYSGYRGEQIPTVIMLHDKKIEVVGILSMWIEESPEERTKKRFFKVKGSDETIYKIFYDENVMEWFYRAEARGG